MSKLSLCLFALLCLRIQHSYAWFWFDDSEENGKGTQTPAYLSTVMPTSQPRTEPPRKSGTRPSVIGVSNEGEKLGRYLGSGDNFEGSAGEGESEFISRTGLEGGSRFFPRVESESRSGSGSEYTSGTSQYESQDDYVTSPNLSHIFGEKSVHAGNLKLETNSSNVKQVDGHNTDEWTVTNVNVSFKNVSSYNNTNGHNSTVHDNYDNTTQYSLEYFVPDNLLTTESEQFVVATMSTVLESPRCLPIDSDLPFCTRMGVENFLVPNFLNQSSVEDVRVVLTEWAWLLGSNCHHSLEWFFCLLLTPPCNAPGSPPPLPCRRTCEVLRDSCWMLLDEGRLPVECHSLPEDEHDGYQCLSVSNKKGNGRLECHLLKG